MLGKCKKKKKHSYDFTFSQVWIKELIEAMKSMLRCAINSEDDLTVINVYEWTNLTSLCIN